MTPSVVAGLILAFLGRVAYYHVYARQQARGRSRQYRPDNLVLFLLTMGAAITAWFLLERALGWRTPMAWRIAAIGTGFFLADGVAAWLRRR